MKPGSIAISLFDQPPPAPDGVRAEVVATTAEEFTSQSLRHLMTELVGLVVAGTHSNSSRITGGISAARGMA